MKNATELTFTQHPVKLNESPTLVPDGSYAAKISGYQVILEHNAHIFSLESSVGVRGMNCPCVVIVNGGKFYLKI